MKKKNISKKALAILLSFIMIATSIPFAIMSVAAGSYDPAPKFSEAAIKEGADAWLDDEGNVQVTYPAAEAEPTYKGEALSIAFYILELVDMGANNATHTNVVLDTIKSTGTSATFKAADIGDIDLESKRYSVTITAVDTENWFSQPIYTTVTYVPKASINADDFHAFSTSETAVREMTTFDKEGNGDTTSRVSGNAISYLGVAEETGTVDLNDNVSDTSALRFIMRTMPDGGQQTFDTTTSRETWDFSQAEEVWYWLDLSNVELTGISFRLRANEKVWIDWGTEGAPDGGVSELQKMGNIIYSTKGYTGTDGYVWVQRDNGGWDKVNLDGGTVDLGNFKGYVRVPIEFICSETASYTSVSNQGFGSKPDLAGGLFQGYNLKQDEVNTFSQKFIISKVLVDPAGTNIKDALLMQHRAIGAHSGVGNANSHYWYYADGKGAPDISAGSNSDTIKNATNIDAMLAAGLSKDEVLNDTEGAYVSGTSIDNKANAYKAIDDLYSVGFAFSGSTEESLNKSFFVDNVFFYDEDGEPWPSQTLDGVESNTGNHITDYYSEELAVSEIIFDEIDKYIADPDWSDYREISYVLDLIEAYRVNFEAKGKSTDFLDPSKNDADDGKIGVGLAWAEEELNRDSWAKAWEAYELCLAAGTLDSANADKYDLVPIIVQTMEKLPEPEDITTISDGLKGYILDIWKAYSLLNLGQIEMLGEEEEQEVLKYIALIKDNIGDDFDEFVVGTSLSNKPFILFDDFENYELGTKSYQLEDAPDIYYKDETAYTDYRYTKNLVTYVTDSFEDFAGKGSDTTNSILSQIATYQPTKDGFRNNLKANAAWADITDKGFQGTKGATVTVDSNFYSSGEGLYNIVSTTYKGAEAANIDALRATGTGNSSVLLGEMAKDMDSGPDPWLSLVFYVDFTQLTDFNLGVTIQTYFDDTLNDFQINMGTAATDQKFYILDETSGEWVQANNAEDAGRMFAYTSKAGADTTGDGVFDITLAGYKGYIRIPLYHFKPGNNSQKLDHSEIALNNIYRISIGVAPGSQAGADEMYGKSFTIDNIGFTYDPTYYSEGVAAREAAGITDVYFDEFFGAKSLPAKKFENAVGDIDLYNDVEFKSKYNIARSYYEQLTEYQKSVVADTYDILINYYKPYYDGTLAVPNEEYSPVQLSQFVDTLPQDIKDAKVTGTYIDENGEEQSYDIPYPGFDGGVVDYASMGIDKAKALEIIDYYNKGYNLFSNSQKYEILSETTRNQFLNAYNMAMRLTSTLEDIRTDSLTFLPEITALYTMKYDYNDDGVLDDLDESVADGDSYKIGNFISIAGKAEVQTFKTEKYDKLQYYSKTSIDDGSIYQQLQNTSRGFTYFLNNTREFDLDGDGETDIQGGILTFQKKMQNIYNMANTHITDKTLFGDDELQSIKDIIAEYNALLPAYYNVEELYELEQAIIRLFPTASVEFTADPEILLTEEKLTGDTTTYKVTYSEVLDLNDKGDKYYVRVTSANGAMTNAYNDSVPYNIAIGSTTKTSGAIVAGTPYEADVANNTYTPGNPLSIAITPSLDSKPTGLSGAVYDELTVELVYYETVTTANDDGTTTDTVVETVVDGSQQTIYVSYSMGDAYTVTIPASFPVEWDSTKDVDVSYSVTTEMVATSKLTVGVTSDGTGKMPSVSDASLKLDYTTANFVETEFGNRVTNAKPDPAPTVTVSGWDAVPVGEYRTTLTYTVVYDDGTT